MSLSSQKDHNTYQVSLINSNFHPWPQSWGFLPSTHGDVSTMAFSQEEMMELIAMTWDRRFFWRMWWPKWAKPTNYEKKLQSRKPSRKMGVSKNAETLEYFLSTWHYVTSGVETTWGLCRSTQNQHGNGIRILPDAKELALTIYNSQHRNASTKVTWLLEQVSNIPNGVPSRRSISTYLTLRLDPICHDRHRIGSVACSFLYVSSSCGLFAILRTTQEEMKTCS